MSDIEIDELKQKILPYFIEIYGEEYRDVITSRMNTIVPIFYNTVDNEKAIMYKKMVAKRIELTIEFLEHYSIFVPEEVKKKMIENNNSNELHEVTSALNFLNACFGSGKYCENSFSGLKEIIQEPTDNKILINHSIDALKKFNISVNVDDYNEWVLTTEAKHIFTEVEEIKNYIKSLDIKFEEFNKQFNNLNSTIDKVSGIRYSFEEQYMTEFFTSLSMYFNEKDKKLFDQYILSDNKDLSSFKREADIYKIVGNFHNDNGLLLSFDAKANEQLADPKTYSFTKKTIIENRIMYYTLLGKYNAQLSPEEFLLTNEAELNVPDQKFIDDIISKKEFFLSKFDKDYFSIASSYEENFKKIDLLGLEEEVSFGVDDIKNGTVCINPNIKLVDGKANLIPLLFFSTEACLDNYVDVSFIHEVNHAVELSLLEYKNNKAKYKCGFETITNDESINRDYTQFSEVVNHMIAIDITEAMHRDNVYLFDNPAKSKSRGGTSYEHQRMLIQPFWTEFREDIMRSRVDNNLEVLFNVIGEDNFNRLNNNINEYVSLPYYKMMEDVINKRDTELTKKRIELIKDSAMICYECENNMNSKDYAIL